ncbi:MAG: asparagine synthase-related protein [Paludibacter sp.]|nr:asparagine synthase-related protein [Paludibacter sp.]
MSAIFGIINKSGKQVEESDITAIKEAISHRSTDGKGVCTLASSVFGHCRLYINPQQKFENQPYTSNGLTITADARLDNRKELSKWIDLDKQCLSEISDDRLILMAYRKWGRACVNYLDGEYAFVIWDQQNQQLFAATDPIGFRSFYYYDSPDVFIFCSEIKGIVAAKHTPNYFEKESLIDYFYRKGTSDKTYNKEVFALCGGNTLLLKDWRIDIHKYWTLKSTGKYRFKKDEEWYDCTRDILYRAVEKRLNSDVPTGVTLSGGLDSTSIACILSELLMNKNKPLYAFSSVLPVGYKGIEKDERHYIEIVGKHCPNIIQTYVEAPDVGPLTDIEEAFDIEETFPNCFFYMDKAILQAASEKNIRNLFNGFGGDYWISNKGNSVIYMLLKQGRYKLVCSLIRQFSQRERTSFFHEFRIRCFSHTKAYQQLRSVVKNIHKDIDWQKKTFLQDDFVKKYSERLNAVNEEQNVSDRMKLLIDSGQIGRKIDRLYNRNGNFASDSASVLFDKDLMEFLYDIPERLLIENGMPRNLLRSSMQQIIPQAIFNRTDKLPYSPGFPGRIRSEKLLFEKIATSPDSFICKQFINHEEIMDHFDEIKSFSGFGQSNKIVDGRISEAGIFCYLINMLYRRDYIINTIGH